MKQTFFWYPVGIFADPFQFDAVTDLANSCKSGADTFRVACPDLHEFARSGHFDTFPDPDPTLATCVKLY